MPYALPSFLGSCSVGSADPLLSGSSDCHSYSAVSNILLFLALAALLYNDLCYACWDSVCTLHAGIACLALYLHAGMVCLAFLACVSLLLIGAYSRVSVVSLAIIGGYL